MKRSEINVRMNVIAGPEKDIDDEEIALVLLKMEMAFNELPTKYRVHILNHKRVGKE